MWIISQHVICIQLESISLSSVLGLSSKIKLKSIPFFPNFVLLLLKMEPHAPLRAYTLSVHPLKFIKLEASLSLLKVYFCSWHDGNSHNMLKYSYIAKDQRTVKCNEFHTYTSMYSSKTYLQLLFCNLWKQHPLKILWILFNNLCSLDITVCTYKCAL
jgi:hypothetical protein